MSADRINVDAIRSAISISDVVGRYVQLKKAGPHFEACCPFHEERTPSFKVTDAKHLFQCFGCGAHGDQIDFIKKREGLDFKEAAARVMEMAGIGPATGKPIPPAPAKTTRVRDADPVKAPIMPVPADAPKARLQHPKFGTPSRTWEYRDAAGQLTGYVCRFDIDGRKEVCPHHYTAAGWRWVAAAKPRALYGLELLAQRPAANVVIVEGEKACDAARGLFPGQIVMSWPGGTNAVQHADWTPLKGRKVVLWPDWDRKPYKSDHPNAGQMLPTDEQVGMKAMLAIADKLGEIGAAGVRIAMPPTDKADGWDAADAVAEGWTETTAAEWMTRSLYGPAQVRGDADAARAEQRRDQLSQQEEPPTPAPDEGPPPDFGEPAPRDDGSPFQCLGYDHGDYYYLARGAKQVMRLSGAGHTKNSLMMLAPLSHWEREFPTKNGADWDMAANALMRSSERVGVYDPSRVRGRGAWWDDGKPVLHIGDRLIVSGREYGITDVRSRFIYEAAPPLRVNTANPLAISEAVGLVDVCKLLPWEKPIHALLLAGWCVIAPACGALKWRSHIWVTGPAGSGKSWVYENILVRCLGDIALAAASETTEAGLRQVLGTDARPVVFDEAEGENARAQARIQNVLALMRQASSETSAAIYKGTSTGDGVRYITRSCFAFSSIGVGLQQHADQTRVSVLSLTIDQAKTPSQRAAHFSDVLEPLWLRTITPEFVDRLHARTVSLLPVIRKNAETFAVAGASVIGTRRLGDQLGALIAGAYSLHSNKEITLDAARKWLSEQDWTDQTQVQEQRDEVACLSHLLQHVIGIQTERGRADRSMGELVARVARTVIDPLVPGEQAHEALKRHGMRVEGDYLVVANGHTAIGKILANTPWSRNWSRTLVRLPDTMKMTPMRFGGSSPDRSVAIPLGVVFGDERNEPIDGTDPQLDNALDAD